MLLYNVYAYMLLHAAFALLLNGKLCLPNNFKFSIIFKKTLLFSNTSCFPFNNCSLLSRCSIFFSALSLIYTLADETRLFVLSSGVFVFRGFLNTSTPEILKSENL